MCIVEPKAVFNNSAWVTNPNLIEALGFIIKFLLYV